MGSRVLKSQGISWFAEVAKLLTIVTIGAGCGTLVGNPKKPGSDPVVKNEGEPFEFPLVQSTLPESVIQYEEGDALNLVRSNRVALAGQNTILHNWSNRVQSTVSRVNEITARLSQDDGIASTGSFKGKGSRGLLSGAVARIDDEEGFDYEAIVCFKGEAFLNLKWDVENEKIHAIRDFAVDPLDRSTTFSAVGELVYEYRDEVEYIESRIFGRFSQPRLLNFDGPNLAESIHLTNDGSKIDFSGVNDWFADDSADLDREGDAYLVGRLDPEGVGEFVAFRKANPVLCRKGFDEGRDDLFEVERAAGAPGFCLGNSFDEVSNEWLRGDEIPLVAARLASIGLTSKNELQPLAINSTLECPSE